MFRMCYMIEFSTETEAMFEELGFAGFNYEVKTVCNSYFEITFDTDSIDRVCELQEIMQWYV